MFRLIISSLFCLSLFSCSEKTKTETSYVKSANHYVFDSKRNRSIPTQVYSLSDATQWNGELVILNAGYGSSNTEYDYITQELANLGYYVISIQHEIQGDEMLPSGEDVIGLRTPNWEQGAHSIERVLDHVYENNPTLSKEKIHLIGHSNGGDISVLFARHNPDKVASLITLDHRRMPIPLTKSFPILSIRSDQFEADPEVIPSKSDQEKYGIHIINLEGVDHNYLRDIATKETKEIVLSSILSLLK